MTRETSSENTGRGIAQFEDAENLLPFGARLRSITGTEMAIHTGYYDPGHGRDHRWAAHAPDYNGGEYIGVRISSGVGQTGPMDFEDAAEFLEGVSNEFYDYELVSERIVPIETTPIPYKRAGNVSVECPECDAWGQTHAWNLEDYLPDECPSCGYGGEMDVR